MEKKKICLVIPSLQAGGMERVMSELAYYFCTKDYVDVHLVLYGRSIEVFYNIPDNLIVYIPGNRLNINLKGFIAISRLIYLRKTIRRIKPDTILSFGEYWNSFVLIALLCLPYPVYISDRCSPLKKFSLIHSSLRRILYKRAKGIIAQTSKARDIYLGQFKNDNITIIGNPVRILNTEITIREKIVLTVGRLIDSKNHDKIIQVFCKINKPGWRLVIVGGDAIKQKNFNRLSNLIKDLNAGSKVILAGNINSIELYYQQSSIFAFASTSEGFPNVILEALASGLPVVSFDCIAGPSDMIANGQNGFLVPVNDYEHFREKLEIFMSDESLRNRMGSEAQNSIKEFSLENIGEKYLDFIL